MSKVVNRQQINHVLSFYDASLDTCTIAPLGNGLINCTYLVSNQDKQFVLQRINHQVFKHPEQVINNAELLSEHIKQKHKLNQYALSPIWQIHTNAGTAIVKDNGSSWRALNFITDSYTVESVSSPEQAAQVATAFGQFTAALADFPAGKLNEIIPNFHHLDTRLAQLTQAVNTDPAKRLQQCQQIVDFCLAQQDFIEQVATLSESLPIRVTHNDTKINNLLFSRASDKPIAVIDLDTCMAGFIMNDFGDMVRTCCSTEPEDGTNLTNMAVKIEIFQALAQAYIKSFSGTMSELEKHSLVVGTQLLPFMLGIRFLTDFINGDNYFHTKHPLHNLERAKNQLHFFTLLQKLAPKLSDIIQACD
ncbi:aminoglycoside phosphotransferase family protein [Thalassotalea sp. G2M2-11]|uniref:phosphotransferase enzyme family protein n=1 Tax=Thalassotalea sp. G2M2-11 TaxID=2787627 RepID=UPI0019D2CBA5|nr:aminoglycoside phosphotransferase family protein [Thalassotalea sp. G2M2-11]